jgi:tetratricopeptide (TPR) repeat protein
MRRALPALALLLGLPLSVAACLWDRDTPVDEAKGMPEVVAVLTGRFARNPPLFYEMRLGRVTAHLRSHPEDLAAYDDAGVACDRLGRGDEAISWMEKKRARLDELDASRLERTEHLYRYHANLGTFLVHRWARRGADRTKIDEVKAARDEIAKALEINPDAHFGREKYQLQALEWIIDPPEASGQQYLPNLLGWAPQAFIDPVDPKLADGAVRGLAGLIVLGNAWESVDVFHALNVALQHDTLGFAAGRDGGRNTLAYLAWLRCRELIDAGKGSMLPDAPEGEDLKSVLPRPEFLKADALLDPAFVTLRAEADAWQMARTAFMTRRLKEGRHPDTDRDFWDGYTERPAPGLPTKSVPDAYNEWQAMRQKMALLVFVGIPALAVALVAGSLAVRSARARRRKARQAESSSAESADGLL